MISPDVTSQTTHIQINTHHHILSPPSPPPLLPETHKSLLPETHRSSLNSHLMPPPSPHTTTARVGSTTAAARGREILREDCAGTVSDDTNICILCCDLRRRAAATQDGEGVAKVARAARHTHAGVADVVEWAVAGGAGGVVRRPPWQRACKVVAADPQLCVCVCLRVSTLYM